MISITSEGYSKRMNGVESTYTESSIDQFLKENPFCGRLMALKPIIELNQEF